MHEVFLSQAQQQAGTVAQGTAERVCGIRHTLLSAPISPGRQRLRLSKTSVTSRTDSHQMDLFRWCPGSTAKRHVWASFTGAPLEISHKNGAGQYSPDTIGLPG